MRAFQQHLIEQGYTDGITADGVATPLTQFCLYSDQYSTYLRDVTPGVADSEAQRIERRLNQLGYMDLPADVLDDYAIEAMKLFQDQCIMQKDGLADRETIDALFSIEAPPAIRCAPHDIATGDSGQVVRRVETAFNRMKELHMASIDALNAQWQDFLCGLDPEAEEPAPQAQEPDATTADGTEPAPEEALQAELEEKVGAIADQVFSLEEE